MICGHFFNGIVNEGQTIKQDSSAAKTTTKKTQVPCGGCNKDVNLTLGHIYCETCARDFHEGCFEYNKNDVDHIKKMGYMVKCCTRNETCRRSLTLLVTQVKNLYKTLDEIKQQV